jgi:peptidoglycan hydrolase CwlO-like protein
MFRSIALAAVIAALPFARAGAQSSATPDRPVGELAPVTVTAKSQSVFGRAANLEADRNQLNAMNRENRRLGAVLDRQDKEILKLEGRLASAKAENDRKVAQIEATEKEIAELRKRRQALEAALKAQQ